MALEKDLFGADADWNGLIAVDAKDEPIGLLFYSITNLFRAYNQGAMIQIDELYVKPDARKKGVGKALLKSLAKLAQEKNIQRIYVWCVKGNEQGKKFYEEIP
jgi:GNAT superfamily N-acetyltransferase